MLLDDAENCRRKMGAATALIGGLGVGKGQMDSAE